MATLFLDSGANIEVTDTETKGEIVISTDDVSTSYTLEEIELLQKMIYQATSRATRASGPVQPW